MTGYLHRRSFLSLPLAGMASRLLSQSTPPVSPEVELELTAKRSEHRILPGDPTSTWSYSAKLLKGRAGTIGESVSFPGPSIRLRRGDTVRIHLVNELPEPTIVHWHGLAVPEHADGHPRLAIPTGTRYVYDFRVDDRAGHYWYHPHPHERTGSQVYRGLAGQLFVQDDEELALGLPSDDHEIPLVLQDRTFDGKNQLVYAASHMEAMRGFLGQRILVNGRSDMELQLGTGAYRLRILNGSNSRIYKLAWIGSIPITVIGADGGLLERPLREPYLTLAPGERADVILDLSGAVVGSSMELRSLHFPAPAMMGMMGGMSGGMRGMTGGGMGMQAGHELEQGAEFRVLGVRVVKKETGNFRLPLRLSAPGFGHEREAVNPERPRVFPLSFMHMEWFLNESQFEMDAVKENEIFDAAACTFWNSETPLRA